MADAIAPHASELANLLTAEQGKPILEARAEIDGSVDLIHAFAGMDVPVKLIEESETRRVEQRNVPLGVVAAIAPWNAPVVSALWKVAPALLTGNCVILKPSPFTPLTTLRIGEILRDVVPAGVLNVISGDDGLGPLLTSHSDVDKIAFTGSTATGRRVLESAAPTIKRVTLELGGNDAAIVLADADFDATVAALFLAAFRNSGQICIAAKRIYVHASIHERFRDAFTALAGAIKIGNGADEGVQMGPLQNHKQMAHVVRLIEDCRDRGLRFAAGENSVLPRRGYFLPITIIDNPPDDAAVVTEEQFGPILPLLRFETIDEVIERVNAGDFGLGGSIWSRDTEAAVGIARRLECGTVWINEAQYLTPFQPFGGHKQSGLGVESGLEGLLAYTNTQIVSVRRPAGGT